MKLNLNVLQLKLDELELQTNVLALDMDVLGLDVDLLWLDINVQELDLDVWEFSLDSARFPKTRPACLQDGQDAYKTLKTAPEFQQDVSGTPPKHPKISQDVHVYSIVYLLCGSLIGIST